MIIVIPMAGHNSRFKEAAVTTPKPLINVRGQWMVEWALRSFNVELARKIIFLILRDQEDAYGIKKRLEEKYGAKSLCVFVDQVTAGPASTVLLAKKYIDTDEDIIIKDCDGYIISNIHDVIGKNLNRGVSGVLSTTNLPGERYSFAQLDEKGFVCRVAEKKRISDHVIAGAYYFRHGSDFVKYAEKMITENKRIKNEFYIAPVYQEMINDGKKIIIDEAVKLWELGTPETLGYFLENFTEK